MIKILLSFALLSLSLNASKILSYNIYDRTDRVDVMITFDTPYDGQIKQSVNNSSISIKLQDASIESAKLKQLSSKFIRSLSITPMSGFTKIVVSVSPSVKLTASKTSDAYGLRLRFSDKVASPKLPNDQEDPVSLSSLPTKKSDGINQSYYIVIAILIIGIIILLFINKRVTPAKYQEKRKELNKNNTSWLFKETNSDMQSSLANSDNSEVSIRFQKSIDAENSVVMLDFAEQSYLVFMGNNNVLLDRFKDDKPQSQDDFNTILQNRHEELDNYLHPKDEPKEPLQAYKERAASISYEV